MATVSYPPYYSQKITDNAGQPVAGGKILSYYAGSDVPLEVYTEDGTSLGAEVMINGAGEALFCLKAGLSYKLVCKDAAGALVWTRDNVKVNVAGDGMANPMEAQADLIVGGPGGQPERLAAPANASFLRSYKNSDNVNVVKWAKLQAGANVTITDAGTQVTVAADTQPGDHKTAVDGSDASPDYLAAKLSAGTGISLTNTGSAVQIAATAQTGDHQLLVSATDASAGYLGAKLTAGSNVTLTTQTDGDGVQSIEISAAGGGADWRAFKYEPRPVAPVRLSWDPAGATNKTLCWVDALPPGLAFSKVYLFPDWVNWGDNMKTAPDRYGWAVYRRLKVSVRSLASGETYSKNPCTGQMVNGLFEISSTQVLIPDDEYVYFIGIMVSTFYKSSYSYNINLIGTDPVDYHNWSGINMPAGSFTNYTDLGPSFRGYATDGTMASLPDNYIACGNYNTSPYSQRIAFPWWACK